MNHDQVTTSDAPPWFGVGIVGVVFAVVAALLILNNVGHQNALEVQLKRDRTRAEALLGRNGMTELVEASRFQGSDVREPMTCFRYVGVVQDAYWTTANVCVSKGRPTVMEFVTRMPTQPLQRRDLLRQ